MPTGVDFGAATVVRLPPVKAGPTGFADLVDPHGRVFGPADQATRRDLLLAHFEAIRPDILLIEAFPFGRRQMRFELLPLIEAAKKRATPPLIAASVRDILQENRKPSRDRETVALVRDYFDLVIVHGDPALAPLQASFPFADEIVDWVVYSGLVGPTLPYETLDEHFDVIVSVGGGAVGTALITAALAAKPLSRAASLSWLVLTGPNRPAESKATDRPGVTMRTFEANLPARLLQAKLSISQAGYNTVADIFSGSECRSVLVPHAGIGETEQVRRASLLQERGWAIIVREADLSPQVMAEAVDRALDLGARPTTFGCDGAVHTVDILLRRLGLGTSKAG